jgi:glutamate-1-semialdehyde 2,1-aminomutase
MKDISKSEALFERAKKVAPGGVHSPVRGFRGVGGTPRFFERAKGARFWDVDGHEYIDFCLSWGPLMLGHQDSDVLEAVKGALTRGWTFGAAEPYSLELAEFIQNEIPFVQKMRFVNSGTEAVMSALRLARAATGRSKILKFEGCYHGHVDSLLVKSGSGLAEMASPDSAGISAQTAAETIVVPLDNLEALDEAFTRFGRDIAALIVEPVPANYGLLVQKPDFLREVAKRTKANGSLLIFDEVITGFRVAFGGMATLAGLTPELMPDLVCYGKLIGGGFPVGTYGGRADLMDWVAPMGPVYQAGTLAANPVAMTAGLVTLKKLRRLDPYADLERKCEALSVRLEKRGASVLDVPVKLQRFASMFWMVLGEIKNADGVVRRPEQIPAIQKERFAKLFHGALEQGVYLAPSGFEVGFLSTAHTDADLDRLVETLA